MDVTMSYAAYAPSTCPSAITHAALPAACHMPLATSTAMKHASCRYGNVYQHTVLPFVVDHMHAGGINKEGIPFFRMCRDACIDCPITSMCQYITVSRSMAIISRQMRPAITRLNGIINWPKRLMGIRI